MTTVSLDDLTQPLTRQEVEASIYDVIARLGVNTTSWKPGAVVRTMIVAASIVMAAFTGIMADIARSGFLEKAAGGWLTLVARYVYGVERELATFATGAITLRNTGGGIYVLDAGDLIALNTIARKTYRNVDAITVGAGATITISVRATEVGTDSNATAGAIDALVTTLLGVVCDGNATALVALDDQKDSELRARCAEQLGALSPMGPWDAYSSAVRNAKLADGTRVGITRVRIAKDGYGNVTVYCATASGGVEPSDLAIAQKAVEQKAEPQAVTATAVSATPVPIAVTYTAWLYNTSGRTGAQVVAAISVRLRDFMAGQPIGGNVIEGDPGKVFVEAIRAAIGSTLPEIFHVVITAPAADVELAAYEVPTLGTVTPTAINSVSPPEGYVS